MSAWDRVDRVMDIIIGRDVNKFWRVLLGLVAVTIVLGGAIFGLAAACEAVAPCTAKEPGRCPMYCTGYKGQTYICGWRDCEECTARRWYWEQEAEATP